MTTRLMGMLALLTLAGMMGVAQAQTIVPAQDGTGTIVTPLPPGSPSDPTVYDITGGSLSGDQLNLFHSFQQFGLDSNQIANFVANPQLQNILGRVTGGDPSVINGIIQVTGGSPNLYLLNPAGIIVGANASLNIPASFTATTATGIGFGSGTWDLGTPVPNYGVLMGHPTSFLFNTAQPGSLVNAGNLTVMHGRSLNLVGGIVVNTGTLTASGGNITVLSVPNSSLVRLSSPGSLLSLEIDPAGMGTFPLPSPATLPQLLTGSGLSSQATGLAVDSDGTVRLTATNTVIPQQAGMTIVSGTIAVSPSPIPTPHTLNPTPQVSLLGDRVGLFAATINASGTDSAGTVLIGGGFQGKGTVSNAQRTVVDRTSTITADALQTGDGGQVIVWADGSTDFRGTIVARGGQTSGNGGVVEISGKQALNFQGQVDLSAPHGDLGTLLFDPETIEIFDGAGTGTGTNDATLPEVLEPGDPGTLFRIAERTLESFVLSNIVLQASNAIVINDLSDNALQLQPIFPLPQGVSPGSVTFQATGDFTMNPGDTIVANQRNLSISARNITTGNIDTSDRPIFLSQSRPAGSITLTAYDTISTGNLTSSGQALNSAGAITVRSAIGSVHTGALNASVQVGVPIAPGNITLNAAGGITTGGLQGRAVTLTTQNDVQLVGTTVVGTLEISSNTGTIRVGTVPNPVTINAGQVKLRGNVRIEVPVTITSSTIDVGNATILGNGDLTLNAGQGTITLNNVGNTTQPLGSLTATASATTLSGDVYTTGNLNLTGNVQMTQPTTTLVAGDRIAIGGTVTGNNLLLTAVNSITTGGITTSALTGNAGRVTLNAGGEVQVQTINTQAGTNGTGGSVQITSPRHIRVTSTLLDQTGVTASIATSGGLSGGAITLQHGGGDTTPFIVGDATVNGVAAAIVTGTSTLTPPFIVSPGTFTQGNITIVTPTSPPVPPPPTEPPTSPPPTNLPSLPPSTQLSPSPTLPPPTGMDASALYRFQREFVLPTTDAWSVELLDNQPVLVIDRDQPPESAK